MKVIIAGSRSIKQMSLVIQAIQESGFTITEVVSGTARGVDTLGEIWASKQRPRIPVKRFSPNYQQYGSPAALFMRNQAMADYADALIAVRENYSSGTTDMISRARIAKLRVHIMEVADGHPV